MVDLVKMSLEAPGGGASKLTLAHPLRIPELKALGWKIVEQAPVVVTGLPEQPKPKAVEPKTRKKNDDPPRRGKTKI